MLQEDMVCLSCTATGERVCLAAEGFGNRHCFLENIADKVSGQCRKRWNLQVLTLMSLYDLLNDLYVSPNILNYKANIHGCQLQILEFLTFSLLKPISWTIPYFIFLIVFTIAKCRARMAHTLGPPSIFISARHLSRSIVLLK